MKTVFSRTLKSPWQLILQGVLVAVLATAVMVVVFALIVSVFDLSDGVIHTVNQLIKVLSVGIGVFTCVSPGSERGLVRGAIVGGIYAAAGVGVYALLTGQSLSSTAYAADILMGIAAGGLIGLLRARAA